MDLDLSTFDTDLFPMSQTPLTIGQAPEILSSLFFLLASGPTSSEGLFTNFSLEPSWRWYFTMTPFETLFLGLILMQFAVLNLFGIFPMNLNTVLNGMPSGRKKREAFGISQAKKDIASQLLKLLKKLDPDECSFKSICELGIHSCMKEEIPEGISSMLGSLKLSAKKRKELAFVKSTEETSVFSFETETIIPIPEINDEVDILQLYEEALNIGENGYMQNHNATDSACGKRYYRCPLNGEEIMDYIKTIHDLDRLL